MVAKDLYKMLGIKRNASAESVKAGYRRMSMKCHPDKFPNDLGAVERFKEVQEAFEVLSDHERRKHYDATGEIPARTVDDRRQKALSALSSVLHALLRKTIDGGNDPAKFDVVEHVKKALNAIIEGCEKKIRELEKTRETLADVAGRFGSSDDDGALSAITRAPLRDLEHGIHVSKEELVALKDAYAVARGAKFNRKMGGALRGSIDFGSGDRSAVTMWVSG